MLCYFLSKKLYAMHGVLVNSYWVNLKFKDCNLINASFYTYLCIAICVISWWVKRASFSLDFWCGSRATAKAQRKGCSLLKSLYWWVYFVTAALDCQSGQNKGRYRKKELSLLLMMISFNFSWAKFFSNIVVSELKSCLKYIFVLKWK